MSFSKEIKTIRQKSLLSQEDFAKELGVAFTTVNRWESGKCKPTYRTMKLLNNYCKKHKIEFDIEKELMETEQD